MNSGRSDPELDGVWLMVRAELDGALAPECLTRNTSMELSSGRYWVKFHGETTDAGLIELGPETLWRTMRLHSLGGEHSGQTTPCIYQVTGNRLRICCGINGVLPTEFRARAGESRYLAVYKRVFDRASPAQAEAAADSTANSGN